LLSSITIVFFLTFLWSFWFSFLQEVAFKNGLILVDTKYEFGKADDGTIMLIDEVVFSS
jgi:phosphoribosylaminoimidazole-succinocarboxamide synthase